MLLPRLAYYFAAHQELAAAFCEAHGLDSEVEPDLADYISEQMRAHAEGGGHEGEEGYGEEEGEHTEGGQHAEEEFHLSASQQDDWHRYHDEHPEAAADV